MDVGLWNFWMASFCFNEIVKQENKTLANFLKTQDKKNKNNKANHDDEHEEETDARQKTNKFFNDLIFNKPHGIYERYYEYWYQYFYH